jgi:hypothetical protein
MNYKNIYDDIILKAKLEYRIKSLNIYYEKHHILPKCLNGTNDKENLVLLTAREHYICHKLLTYIYKRNYKIISAFAYMSFNKKYGKVVSGRDYEYAKKIKKEAQIGRKHSEETKQKMSLSHKGIKTWNMGLCLNPRSEETKTKIKNTLIGIVYSIERNEKISKKLTGRKISEKTKQKMSLAKQQMSEETKQKMSESRKGRYVSEFTKQKISQSLKNKNKNKLITV